MFLSVIYAAIENPVVVGGNQDGATFFGTFIPRMVTLLFIVGSLAFFFMLLIGAVRWVISGGDKSSVEGARAQITQALTGLFIMVSIWAIAKLVQSVFGINILNIDLSLIIP